MTFKASKLRIRRVKTIGRGTPIIPSTGIESWYRERLMQLTSSMIDDYRRELLVIEGSEEAAKFFAMDASLASIFKSVLNNLNKKWSNVFRAAASITAKEFTDKTESAASDATLFSLSAAGIPEPIKTYNDNIRNTVQSTVSMNETLIKNIQADENERIFTAVMLSLSSPDKEKQGQKGISDALNQIGIVAKHRVDLIVRDQTSKLYCSIATERMRQNNVTKFEWAHSSAGKVPRQDHVEKNGKIFAIDDPALWTGPKADRGPPGWAINCRCRMIPII